MSPTGLRGGWVPWVAVLGPNGLFTSPWSTEDVKAETPRHKPACVQLSPSQCRLRLAPCRQRKSLVALL